MSTRLQPRTAISDENAVRSAPTLFKPAGLSNRTPAAPSKPTPNQQQQQQGGPKQGATRRALGDISNAGDSNGGGGSGASGGLVKKAAALQQVVASVKPLQSRVASSSSSSTAPKPKQSAPVQILAPLGALYMDDEDLFTTGGLAPIDGGHISSLPAYRDEELEAASAAFRRTAPKGMDVFSMKGRPASPIMWQPRTDAERAEDARARDQARELGAMDDLDGVDDFGDLHF